jgi:hypothetical protein
VTCLRSGTRSWRTGALLDTAAALAALLLEQRRLIAKAEREHEVPVPALKPKRRVWFAPAVEPKLQWLVHALELRVTAQSVALKLHAAYR